MKKCSKKLQNQLRAIEALLTENRKLKEENRSINNLYQQMNHMYFKQIGYMLWLESENKRLLECMNHGAIAMMDYQNSFQN